MTIGSTPPAEVTVELPTVRLLLEQQHPDLAHLPLVDVGEGWDNRLFRLGDHLAVRLPRRAASAVLVEHEQRWLPLLAPQLPLPIPVPVRRGGPGCGFPWPWSVVPWFPGQSAAVAPPRDPSSTAMVLGRFLHALHQPAPRDAPHNPWRGVPLANRTELLRQHIKQVEGLVSRAAALALWDRVLATPPWPRPPVWIHGDLHPGNLLVTGGRVAAVLDFGDLTAGDPATDLSVMWMLLPRSARPILLASAGEPSAPIDLDTRTRARGWALALGLAYLAASREDGVMRALAQATIDAALSDHF